MRNGEEKLTIQTNIHGTHRQKLFCYENVPLVPHNDSPILVPEVSPSFSISEMKIALHAPFTNQRGNVVPWIRGFMEAARLDLQKTIRDFNPEGKNVFCPFYVGTTVDLLHFLGIPSMRLSVLNKRLLPSICNLTFATAYGYTEILTPYEVVRCLKYLSTDLYDEQTVDEILDKHFRSVEEWSKVLIDLNTLKLFTTTLPSYFFDNIQKHERLFPETNELTHLVSASALRDGTIMIIDINQDQIQHPEIVGDVAYGFDEDGKGYGINPIFDSVSITTYDELISFGFYPNHRPSHIKRKLSPSQLKIVDVKALKEILTCMESGSTIWDDLPANHLQIRENSMRQIETRRLKKNQ